MTDVLRDVFADTAFWIALVVKQDEHHERAQQWSLRVTGRITTTVPVLLESANALSRPAWRAHAIDLIDHLQHRQDVQVVELSSSLWQRSWDLYRSRPDKAWSLTDCASFLVMQDGSLADAMTTDEHFEQAGFRAILREEP